MNMLVLSGSRNSNGQTARAVRAILEGAQNAEWRAEEVFLPTLRLERCRQCEDNGWGICRKQGACIIADDFAGLVNKLRGADAVLLATPVYYSDLSESLRAFLDRLRRICTHETGRKGIAEKPALGVCVAGGGGGGAPACCVSLEKVMANCGFNTLELIPVRRQNLEAKLPQLRAVGAGLAAACKAPR